MQLSSSGPSPIVAFLPAEGMKSLVVTASDQVKIQSIHLMCV